MNVVVYVDGFNLYYALKKLGPYKWLNLKALTQAWLPDECSVQRVKYFSARVAARLTKSLRAGSRFI